MSPESARSTSWAGSRRRRSAAALGLALEDEVGARASGRSRPSATSRSSTPPRRAAKRGVDGRPQHCGLAVHRAARAHHEVGAGHQAGAVDRVLGHGDRRKRQAPQALAPGRACAAARRPGRRRARPMCSSTSSNSGFSNAVVERDVGGRAQDDADAPRRPGRARRAPPGRGRRRPASTPPSGPGSARASPDGRRSGAAAAGGIASGTSTRDASRQLSECWSVAYS